MNEQEKRDFLQEARAMKSENAIKLIINKFPITSINYGEAFGVIPLISWKRREQVRLMKYYFQRIPFANARPYDTFLKFMSLDVFISVIKELVHNIKEEDKELLTYYLEPSLLKVAKNDQDLKKINALIKDISNP